MTKTIAQLWNGSIDPIRCFGNNNSEIKQLEYLLQRNLEKIEISLDEQQKRIFKKYCDCVDEYILVTNEQAFCDGFQTP